MVERRHVVDHLKLNYEGLVSIHDLYELIESWLKNKGFDRRERINQEIVRPTGKHIQLVLEPWKKTSDYVQEFARIEIRMLDIVDVKVKVDGKRRTVQKGKVRITFDGFLDTDYEGKWETLPLAFAIRTLIDKFFYKKYYEEEEHLLVENITQLHHMIRAFLNMHRHDFGVMVA